MKIVWLSPLASTSAIGRYSCLVTNELAHTHQVEAWTFGTGPFLPMSVPVRMFESHTSAIAELDRFDIAVYQIGNHWPFHGEILEMALQCPGIVVLHDHTIQHLMAAYYFDHLREGDGYVRSMRHWHGDKAAEMALAAQRGLCRPVWETEDATLYPLTAAVTHNALGVIAHSEYAMSSIRMAYSGPTVVLPLPYSLPEMISESIGSRDTIGVPSDALLIITTGHVNPNKHVKSVIRAVGELPADLKHRVVYALLGPVEPFYARELNEEAEAAGIQTQVRLEGYVANERLRTFIQHADLCVNLRYPNFEGASASVIEQLLAGKAVITSNTGSFAELPRDVVLSVSGDDELIGALRRLLSQEGQRKEMAARARDFAVKTFRADRYAAAFSDFAEMVMYRLPLQFLMNSLSERMQQLGMGADRPWARSVSDRTRVLFGTGVDSVS